MNESTSYYIAAFILPAALFLTTGFVFRFLSRRFGKKIGYLLGFIFYWNVWCLAVPFLVMHHQEVRFLFGWHRSLFHRSERLNIICLVIPLLFGYGYAFPKALKSATFRIIRISFLLALLNATLEEFFWRGLFLKMLGHDRILFIAVSSIGFAVWHFVPQQVNRSKTRGGTATLVVTALILGIFYGIVAVNTQSILLVTVDHILFDFSRLGDRFLKTGGSDEPGIEAVEVPS